MITIIIIMIMMSCALNRAGVPSSREPAGLFRTDGATLIPWLGGVEVVGLRCHNSPHGDGTKWYSTKWYRQNGTDKMVSISIDSNSTELNFYSVARSNK